MRSYVALSGRENAFGWARLNTEDGFVVSLGGLRPGQKYCMAGKGEITADALGRWQGTAEIAPGYIATMDGSVILCDESSLTWEEASLLAAPKRKQPVKIASAAVEEIKAEEKVIYRAGLNGTPVDALPALVWPKGCEKIRDCFEKGLPVRVLPLPWRFVAVPGTKGQCLVGRLVQNGCIIKTAYAVRAKGGLLQPKGLQGYDYIRGETGEGYWMLKQDVR